VISERRATILGLALLFGGSAFIGLGTPEAGRSRGAGVARHLLADGCWLEADVAWERRDAAAVRQWLGLTLAADPDVDYFRLNAARMIAYDFPTWIQESGARAAAAIQARRRKAAASEALALLERGLNRHPESAALRIEMANLCLYGLGDAAGAARHYRLAAGLRGAPACAARLGSAVGVPGRSEADERQGRREEASRLDRSSDHR